MGTFESTSAIQKSVLAALMAALTAASNQLTVRLFGEVPFTLATMVVLTSGLLLGSRLGALSMTVYLLVGLAGLPVFSGFGFGIAHLQGNTGGYLFGWILGAYVAGFIAERGRGTMTMDVVAVIWGSVCFYVIGVPWLKVAGEMTWAEALSIGFAQFIPSLLIKAFLALVLARALRPVLATSIGLRG